MIYYQNKIQVKKIWNHQNNHINKYILIVLVVILQNKVKYKEY